LFAKYAGIRTLVVGVLLLVLNEPTIVGPILGVAPAWLKPILNLVLSGAGLAFLNSKLNAMKNLPA
jgi:hypothetical protein